MTQRELTANDYRLAFIALAIPFYVNDFGFIYFNGTYGVYLVDYSTRIMVVTACLAWPLASSILKQDKTQTWSFGAAIASIILLPLIGRLAHYGLEAPFVSYTEIHGLFRFHILQDPALYWLDLTVGLFAVALSEELVFRKLARQWLESTGRSTLQIIVISAALFSLMHWGSGPGRLIYTFVGGLFYMAVYLKIGKLWPLIVAHFIEDFLAFSPVEL